MRSSAFPFLVVREEQARSVSVVQQRQGPSPRTAASDAFRSEAQILRRVVARTGGKVATSRAERASESRIAIAAPIAAVGHFAPAHTGSALSGETRVFGGAVGGLFGDPPGDWIQRLAREFDPFRKEEGADFSPSPCRLTPSKDFSTFRSRFCGCKSDATLLLRCVSARKTRCVVNASAFVSRASQQSRWITRSMTPIFLEPTRVSRVSSREPQTIERVTNAPR
jgi:hypothetical protein